jgi:hypothetical protein
MSQHQSWDSSAVPVLLFTNDRRTNQLEHVVQKTGVSLHQNRQVRHVNKLEYVGSGTDGTSILVRCTNICGHLSSPVSHLYGVQVMKIYGILVMKTCIGGNGKTILKWISKD